MLAKRLPTILPPLHIDEALETTKIHSVGQAPQDDSILSVRPFRFSHHHQRCGPGRGFVPQPGEIEPGTTTASLLDKRGVQTDGTGGAAAALEDRVMHTSAGQKFSVEYPPASCS